MEDYRLEQTGPEVQSILNGAAMDANLQAEVERATEAEGRLQDNIDAEERARQDADGLLQQGISDEENRAKRAEEANAGEIEGIKALIPATASDANKLADTNYVNSSIQTATAEYRGDYNVVTDLHLAIDATHAQIETLLPTVIEEADKNDYCYVMIPTSAQTPTEIAKIERYKMTSEGWKFEYDVNNSTFTAEEWAAIKSGITSGLVAKLNALPTNADLLLLLAGKQDVLTFDSVPVPESNNPVKSGGVYSAIDDEKTARLNSDTAIHAELDGLQVKVPATASSDNKLVDQNQMNSSISTATATFRGDWNVVSDLNLAVDATRAQIAALLPTVISTADNNDYCYVEIPTSAETPTQIASVERYKFNGTAWGYEYTLNNSGFTADQWAAINSMITSGLVAKLSALPTNADLLAMLAQKQDNLTFDSTPTENSTNPVTSGGVFAADKALSDAIEAILLLIPSAASALNKLVDTSLMNSSISTATATFRGTYNLVSNLGLGIDATEGQIAAALLSAISTADNNDYAFVQIPTSAETPAQIARTDRYKFDGTAWAFEYTLNTSGFTAAQWAAINSTITSALVAKLNALPTAAELQEALGTLTSSITAINQKIPSTASQSNKLVDNASMESYIAQVINILDASFNVTSTDGHITLHITQVDGVITSVQVQSTDIASAADLALKASQADLTALASRVTTAEGNITSLTGRMGTAETNIANLQQLYNNLQQSKPVPVTALPSTGQQQGVIYRLAGTTSYSDYMWNGSTWVLMATYNNAIDPRPKKASQNLVTSGGVFDNIGALDVSELNATENPHTLAQYTDLSSALAAIPTDYQKGGMSIKFVQTSDNKYVQYRYQGTAITGSPNPFLDVNNWEMAASVVDMETNRNYIIEQTKQVIQNATIRKYSTSEFQSGYINPATGQNAVLGNNYIRTESFRIAKDDFYLKISGNIKGRIYYYSAYALNSFTESIELISGASYYIPVGTFYRLAFCYADGTSPDISDIIDNEVVQVIYTNIDVDKLQTLTCKKFDASIFQLGSISTATGTNSDNNKQIRTTGLLTADENFYISLPDNVRGIIYYYSAFSYASYSGYYRLEPNSMTYVGKGTYYRLILYYVNSDYLPIPVISDLVDVVNITYDFIDKLEHLDLNEVQTNWGSGEIAVATGEAATNNKRIRTGFIQKSEYSICATGGYRVSVYVYNGSTYLGCLNDGNVLSTETIKWWKDIDLNGLADKNPTYTFKLVACRANADGTPIEDVLTASSDGESIKMLTPFEMGLFKKETFCPLVSFIDDDVIGEALDNWYSLGNEVGIRCGFAVPTAEPTEAMWEKIKSMQSAGFDFLSHTHHHINLMNETDPDVINADLQESVDTFISHGIRVNGLVYPQSSISNLSLGIVKKYFEYSFNGVDGIQSIQGNPLRQHNITRSNTVEPGMSDYTDPDDGITYRVHAMLPLATLKAYVDKAVEENCWVIFETHYRNSRTTDPSTNDGFCYTPEMRQETINLIKYAISKGCKVVTPAEGYQILKNRLMHGTYGSNNYHIVDHNGFVYRKNM